MTCRRRRTDHAWRAAMATAMALLACSLPGVPADGPAEIIIEPTLPPPAEPSPPVDPDPTLSSTPNEVVYQQLSAIVVASLGPETGTYSAVFPCVHQGALKAVEDHGPVHGFEVTLVIFDDRCEPLSAARRAAEIVADPVIIAVLGPMCDEAAVTALPVFEAGGRATVAAMATRTDLPTFGPTVFNRVTLNDGQLAHKNVSSRYVQDLPSWQLFNAQFEAWGGMLQEEGNNHWAACAYDAAMVLLRPLDGVAIDQADGSIRTSRPALAQTVRATSGYPGVTGSITFEADGDRRP